jgi:mono/diheme cytochrome c family protein
MKKWIGAIIALTALMSFQTSTQKKVTVKPKTATASTTLPGLKASIDRGKAVYMKQCLACHQADGTGVPHLNAPLAGATAVVGKDKGKIIGIILNGLKGVEIDDEEYSNPMAPHKELTDQQIADVLTYVRNTWTNKASAVTPAEVKAVRKKIK